MASTIALVGPDELVVNKVRLRPWKRDDALDLFNCLRDEHERLRPWIPFVPDRPMSRTEVAQKLAGWMEDHRAGEHLHYAVWSGRGLLLGSILALGRALPDAIEVGFWLTGSGSGKGLIQALVPALLREVTPALPLRFVCDPENERSVRSVRRLGAERTSHEGTLHTFARPAFRECGV